MPHTLIASYPDSAAARRAVTMLRNAGIDDSAISVVGDTAAPAESAGDLVREDRSIIMRIFWAGLIWGGVGAIVGAAIGYVLARIGFPTDNVAIQVASWAMFVHIAATLWAAYAVIYDGTPPTAPRHPHSGATTPMIVVRSTDEAVIARAEAALKASGATTVELS